MTMLRHKLWVAITNIALASMFSAPGHAQGIPSSIFTEALTAGEATTALPDDANFGPLAKALKKKTGSDGAIVIKAKLILRFVQQPSCGRVVFLIMQPSSKTGWDDLGGQLNVCEDGTPPLRMCESHTQSLYPSGSKCPDGKAPVDTSEVTAAINQALGTGGLTHEQVKAKLFSKSQKIQSQGLDEARK